ncbi:MAG: hypothetical protein MJA29_06170 [Candidatus Omnitrophica bacterium]|nr:hypothetical protein [Candidatus Omnitrophota bacterium]
MAIVHPFFDNFSGTEYYVNFSTGTDDLAAGRGASDGDPWKTIKYAIETGITRNATSGDRVNCKDNATHTVATAIDVTQYAADATSAAPLIVQGYTSTPNDGGLADIDVDTGVAFQSSGSFDHSYWKDLDIEGNYNGILHLVDRNGATIACRIVNNDTTGGEAYLQDRDAIAAFCYFEGDDSSRVVNSSLTSTFIGCIAKNNGNGGCFDDGQCYYCVAWSAGNPGAAAKLIGTDSAIAIHCVAVCTGTPNATSCGIDHLSHDMPCFGNYVENVGIGYRSTIAKNIVFGNSYYNVTTPFAASPSGLYVDDAPVDAGSSILTDPSNGDFTIKAGSTDVDELLVPMGFANGAVAEKFNAYIDTATGLMKGAGGSGATPNRGLLTGGRL